MHSAVNTDLAVAEGDEHVDAVQVAARRRAVKGWESGRND